MREKFKFQVSNFKFFCGLSQVRSAQNCIFIPLLAGGKRGVIHNRLTTKNASSYCHSHLEFSLFVLRFLLFFDFFKGEF
jgi:hypothetical protein